MTKEEIKADLDQARWRADLWARRREEAQKQADLALADIARLTEQLEAE